MDEEGYFFLVDRVKRMVNRAGFKVWPAAVENILYKHSAVKEACVVKVPDERVGEEVKAFITLNPEYEGKVTEKEVMEWSKGQMGAHEYPRSVEFVKELPKSGAGKILWRELEEKEKVKAKNGYPGYSGDITMGPFDRKAALETCIKVAEEVKSYGVKTVVDATTNEAGRDPELLKEISQKTGINIVCSSGYYYEGEGAPAYFKFRSGLGDINAEVYEMFKKETTEGIGNTGIKNGVFKLASSRDLITDYEKVFFKAAAKVSKEEGIPIITHTQEGKQGPEQADLLISEGADPKHIMIGHIGGSTDIDYLIRTLEKGVYIAFDRFGIQGLVGAPFDNRRVACLIGLIGIGYADKIMMSQDMVNFWLGRPLVLPDAAKKILANWSSTHIFKDIIPMLKKGGVTDEQINTMTVENPKRLFGGE
jgi:phosphotriesterase-related protein